MINNTLDAYNNWGNVADYESDETTVTLLDKNGVALAEFNYPKFTSTDFERYVNTCC
ncbi:hypothetical protein Phi4:1_gp187 [Cellulophaga phage phi4:1]|uniref:Uncharacterized protein n=3 Tax=Lightbulbvirus Cba41 TaxID=1918524 RepID=A0A0S2MWX7_9CAUD|nr:hypothetical protein Phi4:1_gp187 [Cellulophaga phage phi4:1]AGO49600.1 hypothetical protein Phi4:1_gp187 [Cellulophaga phage phi4:1]ALO80196.1 hypothetical protein Phi4113_187 [Cellulophaga phage phi4:1_13]ALO80393.1 hypothetical protein Phi4118_187 [Cellulophaga phage phi4:1_18]